MAEPELVFEIPEPKDARFAYTLNNDQPVLCSLISDDPLFYLDYDSSPVIDGHAFCETCDCVQPYHTEIDREPIQPKELRKTTEFICNTCDSQLMLVFGPDDAT